MTKEYEIAHIRIEKGVDLDSRIEDFLSTNVVL